MITIKPYLKKRKGKNQHSVYIRCSNSLDTILIKTNLQVEEKDWHLKKDPFNPVGKANQYHKYFNDSIRTKSNEIYAFLSEHPKATINDLKEHYNGKSKPVKSLPTNLVQIFDSFILHISSSYRPNTLKNYTDLRKKIISFDPSLELKDIDLKFYDAFNAFLIKKNLANNTIGKAIRNLKALLTWAKDRGYPVNGQYKKFKVHRKPSKLIIYLTQQELKDVYALDLNDCERLDRVRDLFIVQSRTGLRISDLKRLNRHHIHKGVIRMQAYKNQNNIIIKITPWVEEKLIKYDYDLPIISEQKYNKYIKEVCQIAGIKSVVEKIEDRTKRVQNIPKYQLISNHTAVKTFITHCAELGISPKTVSYITGKTVKVILDHYYGTNEDVIINDMKKL